jgi:hypothetical protein
MGHGLLSLAQDFPKRVVCDSWVTEKDFEYDEDDEIDHQRTVYNQRCTSSHTTGEDYTASELQSFATGYCTTECR